MHFFSVRWNCAPFLRLLNRYSIKYYTYVNKIIYICKKAVQHSSGHRSLVYRCGELAKVDLIFILKTFSEPCFGLGAVGHRKKLRPTFGSRHLLFKEGEVG